MALSLLNQGKTDLRDAIISRWTHVGVTEDNTAFSATHTQLNPDGVSAILIKAATSAIVDFQTVDLTMSIDGDTEFTNKTIWTLGALSGATTTDAMTRSVRSQGIGVESGDTFTVGVRLKVEDGGA